MVARSPGAQVTASTMADGTPVWYSSEESELNPSSPISSSAYSVPSGWRCWVCRLGGMAPTAR